MASPGMQTPPAPKSRAVGVAPHQSRPPFGLSPIWTGGLGPTQTQSGLDRPPVVPSYNGSTTPSAPTPLQTLPLSSLGGPAPGIARSLMWMPPDPATVQTHFQRVPSFVQDPKPVVTHSSSWVPPPLERGSIAQQSLSWVPPVDATKGLGPTLSWVPPAEAVGLSSLHFVSAAASRQHPAKIKTGIVNADAVMEAPKHLGICDGVSGVHHLGIPPDELPRDLLRSCRSALLAAPCQPSDVDDGTWLTRIIEEAFDATQAYGATTLLLATLRDSNLITASLGDCALLVLRPCSFTPFRLRPIFKTEPGRYDSRRPVQVQRLHGFSDANAHAVIKGAMVSMTPVQHGDLLVLGSDGLFDNLRDEDIQYAIEQCCSSALAQSSLQRLQAELRGQGPTGEPLLPSPAQLQQVAAVLVDRAIASVRLDQPEDGQWAPWSAECGDVPANNADDTTALVAAVVADARPAVASRAEPIECCAGVLDDIVRSSPLVPQVLRDRTNLPEASGASDPLKAPAWPRSAATRGRSPSPGPGSAASSPRCGAGRPQHAGSAELWQPLRPLGSSSVAQAAQRSGSPTPRSASPPLGGAGRAERRRQGQCEVQREDCTIS